MRDGNNRRRPVSGGLAILDHVLKHIDRESNHRRTQLDQEHSYYDVSAAPFTLFHSIEYRNFRWIVWATDCI